MMKFLIKFALLFLLLVNPVLAQITYIGGTSGSTGTVNNTDTLVLTIPGTYQADDLIVTFATASNGTTGIDITANAEYTEKTDGFPALGTAGNDTNIHAFYRIAASGADTAITLSKAATSRMSAIMMVFRGVDTTTPFDVNPTITINTANDGLNALNPAITPTTANGALVLVAQYASISPNIVTSVGVPATPASLTQGAVYIPGDRNFQDFTSAYLLDYGSAATITPTVWLNAFNSGKVLNGQTETNYNNSPLAEGTFSGGALHAASDVITLTGGVTITVVTESAGVVTAFTVSNAGDAGGHVATNTLSQTGTTGIGTGFSLTLDYDNLSGDGEEWATGTVALRLASGGGSVVVNPISGRGGNAAQPIIH